MLIIPKVWLALTPGERMSRLEEARQENEKRPKRTAIR